MRMSWINIDLQTPNDDEDCWIVTLEKQVMEGIYYEFRKKFRYPGSDIWVDAVDVICWQPYYTPEPPIVL
jgi:hypothetical protein